MVASFHPMVMGQSLPIILRMRCKTCHYSLSKLTEHRCPECGRAFDPKDPGTFLAEGQPTPRRLSVKLAFRALLIAPFLTWVFWVCLGFAEKSQGGMFDSTRAKLLGAVVLTIFFWPVTLVVACALYILFYQIAYHSQRSRSGRR